MMRTERLIALFGILAGLFATAMAGVGFSTGVTQEYFEFIHPADEYARQLMKQAVQLRILFTLDNFFLLSYSSFFLWFLVERRGKVDDLPRVVLAFFLLMAALLDAIENFHILAMLSRAELGTLPSDGEISLQIHAERREIHGRLFRGDRVRHHLSARHALGLLRRSEHSHHLPDRGRAGLHGACPLVRFMRAGAVSVLRARLLPERGCVLEPRDGCGTMKRRDPQMAQISLI